jgi:hypothetical protein
MPDLLPPITDTADRFAALERNGFAVLSAAGLRRLLGPAGASLAALEPFWDRLPPDTWLRDGGHYRFRRHACFVLDNESGEIEAVPHRAHWQPVAYNALHGGIERWFEPVEPECLAVPAWNALLSELGRTFTAVKPVLRWHIEAHPFRIDTSEGIGRPTPEGAHRDGVDFVAVLLVARKGVKGGETRVFAADGPQGMRFTLSEPWTAMLLDDERVIHETTPIQPAEAGGHRDTLVLTFRAAGFQGPAPE